MTDKPSGNETPASRETAEFRGTALKGMIQRPATPVAVEDMNAAGQTARAAVAAMRAFMEEGQALHHEPSVTGDTGDAIRQLKVELLQVINCTELSRAGVQKVLLELAEQASEPAIGSVTPVDGNVFADLGCPPVAEPSTGGHLYETDPVAWADSQAQLLQAEEWERLDKVHILEVLGRVADLFREMARLRRL